MFKTIIKILQGLEDKIDPPKSTTIKISDEAWKAWNSAPKTIPNPAPPYVPGQIIHAGPCFPYPTMASDSIGIWIHDRKINKELETKRDETHPKSH